MFLYLETLWSILLLCFCQFYIVKATTNQYIYENCVISFTIREIQIKNTLRVHPTTVTMAAVKETSAGKDAESLQI